MKIEGGDNLAKVLKYFDLYEPGKAEYKIVCPFHGDVNASMKVNIARGDFYCFGCQKAGVAYDFVRFAYPKLDDLKALQKYSKIIKSKKVRRLRGVARKAKKQGDKAALIRAKEHYDNLHQTNWRDVYEDHYLFKRGYSAKILNDNGVKINTSYNYPVMAPMYDNGVFKGTVCRTSNKKIEMERKYLYNEGFGRQDSLVGNYSKPWVIITEGYFDWLKLRQFLHKTEWYDNCVAILGWKITPEQIKKIQQFTDCVVSALDNTKSGKEGTKILEENFTVVRFQFDKEGVEKDIGDLSQLRFNKMWQETLEKIKLKAKRKSKNSRGQFKNGKRKSR